MSPSEPNEPAGDERSRIEDLYGRYAVSTRKREAWRPDNPGNAAMRAELLARVSARARRQLTGKSAVLDIGCGSGRWLADLRSLGVAESRLHGVDLSEPRLEEAACLVPGVALEHADARRLPFGDGSFALVLLFTVLSSLPGERAIQQTLSEAWRVTEASGLVLCYDIGVPNPVNRNARRISRGQLRTALPVSPELESLTLVPQVARRLGSLTERAYGTLTRVPGLRTHVLATWVR